MIGSDALLDTNAISSWILRDVELRRALARVTRPAIPWFAAAEYHFGAIKGLHRDRNLKNPATIIEEFPLILPPARTIAVYGDVRLKLVRRGSPIPANDLWIASLAIEHGAAIVTRDAHFSLVEGLSVISW